MVYNIYWALCKFFNWQTQYTAMLPHNLHMGDEPLQDTSHMYQDSISTLQAVWISLTSFVW